MSDSDVWLTKARALQASFTPAAPVTDQELFAGRQNQLVRLVDAFEAPGEHAAVFGERGVGKTSLATIAETIGGLRGSLTVRINCQADDDISDVWRRVGEAVDRYVRIRRARGEDVERFEGLAAAAVALLTSPSVGSHDVLTALQMLGEAGPVVVILDEFDRVAEPDLKTMLVDLMKTVADHALPITIVIVGVSETVDNLLDEHESIGRGLNQILMPRMSIEELEEVIDRGLAPAEMVADSDAKRFIASLSMGLPHYTHLMGLRAGLAAVAEESTKVTLDHVLVALPEAAERAQQHVATLYHSATHSTQANIFKEVLLAAALTPTDERGYFAPGDVRPAMAIIMGKKYEIPAFARHLSAFSDDRGPVLQRSGKENRPRYRFVEPLIVPYACMRGIADGTIHLESMYDLLKKRSGGS